MKTIEPVLCASPYCRTDPNTGEPRPHLAADGLVICYSCRGRAINQTGELPHLYAGDLESALTTTGRAGTLVSGTAERGLPLNLAVAEARAEIRRFLRDWAKLVADLRGIHPHGATGLVLADFLVGNADWLLARADYAGKFAGDAHDTWRMTVRAAYPAGNRRVPVGFCPMDDCAGELGALIRDDRPTMVACDFDPGHTWTKAQWIALAPHVKASR